MIYRRRLLSDTWHWRHDCRWWPTKRLTYRERDQSKRPSGDACNECLAKDEKDRRKAKYNG